MRKADKIKLSVIVGVSLLAFVVGCVDTAVQPIPTSVNYKSEVSIVNLTAGTGTATVNVYNGVADQDSLARNVLFTAIDYSSPAFSGQAASGVAVPASSFQEVPAGNKAIVVSYTSAATDTFRLTFDSQRKLRVFIIGDASAGGRSYVKADERYTWQSPGSTDGAALFPAGSGWVAFFNGTQQMGTLSVEVHDAATDSTYQAVDVDAGSGTNGYLELPSGTNYNIIVGSDTVAFAPQSQKRYTTVFYGDTTSGLQVKVLTDD